MPKFFISKEDIQGSYILIQHDVHHITHVLRKSVGDTLTVCDGRGTDYECVILEIAPLEERVVARIESRTVSDTEPETKITLFQSMPKADKMEFVLQKGIEIGISAFQPFYSERSLIHLDHAKAKQKVERWNKIAEAAAKQSGRGTVPPVEEVLTFKDVLAKLSEYELNLVCYEDARKVSLNKILTQTKEKLGRVPKSVSVFIGPEGGFAPHEVDQLVESGALICGLGPRILRTETAGMAAACLILYEYGQME